MNRCTSASKHVNPMNTTTINPKLRSAIKLRHLVEAISTDWQLIATIQGSVNKQLQQAESLAEQYGDSAFQGEFNTLLAALRDHMKGVVAQLEQAKAALAQGGPIDPAMDWTGMQTRLRAAEDVFRRMSDLPFATTDGANAQDWKTLWKVVRSNLDAVQGLCSAAYLKARMIADLGKDEAEALTATILQHIPRSFSLTEADQYERDYLAAMDQIKEDASKKTDLWDRVLNIIAGAIPFEESPAERVMMQRWINGEKGAL